MALPALCRHSRVGPTLRRSFPEADIDRLRSILVATRQHETLIFYRRLKSGFGIRYGPTPAKHGVKCRWITPLSIGLGRFLSLVVERVAFGRIPESFGHLPTVRLVQFLRQAAQFAFVVRHIDRLDAVPVNPRPDSMGMPRPILLVKHNGAE